MVTAETLRQLLDYNPATGVFTWRRRIGSNQPTNSWNTRHAGKLAGRKNEFGYLDIRIFGRHYRGHRLAWLYVTGEWPVGEIDHADCDKMNNVFSNLRDCEHKGNAWNRPAQRGNKSGFKGVSLEKKGARRYAARIRASGKRIYLGCFATPEEAHRAFVEAATVLHGEFARAA